MLPLTQIKERVAQGLDVNTPGFGGSTLLHLACRVSQNVDVVKFLVEHGADVNLANNMGNTPLHHAVRFARSKAMAHLLIGAGADVNCSNENNEHPINFALMSLAHLGVLSDVELERELLVSSSVELVSFLLDNGANCESHTLLHQAIRCAGSYSIVPLLVKYGADVNSVNCLGMNSLHVAIEHLLSLLDEERELFGSAKIAFNDLIVEAVEIVHFLVDSGVDVKAADSSGDTPLAIALKHAHSRSEEFDNLVDFLAFCRQE